MYGREGRDSSWILGKFVHNGDQMLPSEVGSPFARAISKRDTELRLAQPEVSWLWSANDRSRHVRRSYDYYTSLVYYHLVTGIPLSFTHSLALTSNSRNDMAGPGGGLIAIFLTFHIGGGIIGLPLVIASILASKQVSRHPTLLNFCATWTISSIVYTLL